MLKQRGIVDSNFVMLNQSYKVNLSMLKQCWNVESNILMLNQSWQLTYQCWNNVKK